MNEKLHIIGGTPLRGTITASGAKNATTKLLVASIISNKKCIFHNVPNIFDVAITLELCKEIGSEVVWDKENKIVEIQTKELKSTFLSHRFSGANRIPILMIGALLNRTNQLISVPTVGGDQLGNRPLDIHLEALKKLGANIEYQPGTKNSVYLAEAKQGLNGTLIKLRYPSVGATENIIFAALAAKGKTIIQNAAIEPEIVDLIIFLQKMGCNITVDSHQTIQIEYSDEFEETTHTIIPDRNEIVSYACAALATKGDVFIKNADPQLLIPFIFQLKKIKAGVQIQEQGIRFFYKQPLEGNLSIETDVHPGFMTDWQQPFGAMLTQVKGTSIIHETVYENRFGYTKMLNKMGADTNLFNSCLGQKNCRYAFMNHPHSMIIKGPTPLKAHDFAIPDLRAGFAYVIAALTANNLSTIEKVDFLDRGYDNFVSKLKSLGANIERVKTENITKDQELTTSNN
ncbi:MAG TPA: UDP-N-acetylglucosamine 1-carboxyvinyltransferase [Chlamydiales bacterium]|nr:UDP-N-acetylglucosamine 1-carboxyvinyltransferase [Chlamydiales bacterium]